MSEEIYILCVGSYDNIYLQKIYPFKSEDGCLDCATSIVTNELNYNQNLLNENNFLCLDRYFNRRIIEESNTFCRYALDPKHQLDEEDMKKISLIIKPKIMIYKTCLN